MVVDQNAVIKLHKSGKRNFEIAKRLDMNPSTAWKIVKKFQETGNILTDQGEEEIGVSFPLNSSKHEGKAATKPSSKLQNLGHHSRCEKIHHALGFEGRSEGEAFQDTASPGTYEHHVAIRAQKYWEILQEMVDGTLPNLVFTH